VPDAPAQPSNDRDGVKDVGASSHAGRVARGELPVRYAEPWYGPFFEAAGPALKPAARILDVGAGRDPLLSAASRPEGSSYVGLDISAFELAQAPADAYDEIVVGDIAEHIARFENQFDLILSWQVLEHVTEMRRVLENMQCYLKPGGRMVAQLSCRFAAYALLARVVPYRISRHLMATLLSANPEEKFPTRYESCDASSLTALLADWSAFQVIPRHRGASYFGFWKPLEALYIGYEDWTIRSGRANLATHYLVWAVK
jgi:SAM-dependent methyltransferase